MKKHLLLLSVCMAFTVHISAQEVNGKATRLLSCDYTYDNKINNQVDHDTYTYTYDANGLPKVAMRGKTAHPIYLGESFLILYKIYTFVP